MAAQTRHAAASDIPAMVALAEQRIVEYAREQPGFWRKAADSADKYAQRLASHLARDHAIVLVADDDGRICGYLVGVLIPPPPVYDPGGDTCLVDSFAVAEPQLWADIGSELLRVVSAEARARGAVQLVVVCGHHDELKRQMLVATECRIVSEWWHRSL